MRQAPNPTCHRPGPRLRLGIMLVVFCLVQGASWAQIRVPSNTGFTGASSARGTSSQGTASAGRTPNPYGNDTSSAYTDTSATKGLIFKEEVPDSVLRAKVFYFHLRRARTWIDTVLNPVLDPTGAHRFDATDAFDGNYYLGKGTLGHPHTPVFFTPPASLHQRLQPGGFDAYEKTAGRLRYFQTLTPYSELAYGSSLDKDYTLHVMHTQNVMPGWNVGLDYQLLNPDGVYASSGATDHQLSATTNYFSPDSRLQASAGVVRQSFTFDENGGLLYDSIFTQRLQSNLAGIPVNLTGAGTRIRTLEGVARVSYSLERQSDTYRERDSLVVVQVDDSTTRIDTVLLIDTILLRRPRVLNAGVVGFELNGERQKRVFADSTAWVQRTATLYWTNDAYADHRWRNPLKLTLGIRPHYLRAAIGADTMRLYSWVDPFARAEVALGRAVLSLDGEARASLNPGEGLDHRLAAAVLWAADSAGYHTLRFAACNRYAAPDVRMLHDAAANQSLSLRNSLMQTVSAGYAFRDIADVMLRAVHIDGHAWYDTSLTVHQGASDFWLLQARLMCRLAVGPVHLDMQQLAQYCTDGEQMPLPWLMSKNSLYADVNVFGGLLRLQVGGDLHYHTPYHAPIYHPQTGLFLQQDEQTVGGYLWADVFVDVQVKRASIYVKAGHVNALWETPATYFLLPHYPGQAFGVAWGLNWRFFD